MPDDPLPTAREAAMRRIAEVKAQLASPPAPAPVQDPSEPATPLDLIPDARTRATESTRQTFERISKYLPPELIRRLRDLPSGPKGQVVKKIVDAERRKETLATATPTPSPKQRRALAARGPDEAAEDPSGDSMAVRSCTRPDAASEDQQLTEEPRT